MMAPVAPVPVLAQRRMLESTHFACPHYVQIVILFFVEFLF